MSHRPEKKTISGRVPADTEQRFERFRRQRGLNKTDALRRLLDAGLDSHERKQLGGHRPDTTTDSTATDDNGDIGTWLSTRGRRWLCFVSRSAASSAFLVASATLGFWIAHIALSSLSPSLAEELPPQLLAVAIPTGLAASIASTIVAALVGVILYSDALGYMTGHARNGGGTTDD